MGRRRAPILQAIDDQLIGSGLQPDRHSLKGLLWEHAANVTFWNGEIKRKLPAAQAFPAFNGVERINGLAQQYMQDGRRFLWAAQGNAAARWAFGAAEVIGPGFGTYVADATATQRPTMTDFTAYGDWMIVNMAYPGEKAWLYKDADGSLTQPPDWPTGVVKFLKKMNFLVALGYGQRGTQIGWSDADDILTFTAASENLAGSLAIDEFNTPIRAGHVLGDAISVFSEDQLALVRYVGAPYVFGQRTAIDGVGAIGKGAVASDTRVNLGVSRAGIWWTDGNNARYIDEGYLSDYLQEQVNWDQGAKIIAARNDFTGCFEFHFPVRDNLDINEAWSWDPRNGAFSPCPSYAYLDERRLFNYPIAGTVNGDVMLTDFDPTAAAPLELRTKPLVMQTEVSPHTTVRVDEFDLLLHEAANVEVRIGCCDEPDGDWEWTTWLTAEAGAKIYQVPAQEAGIPLPENPYWKLDFRSIEDNWSFNLQGFLLYGATTGTKM